MTLRPRHVRIDRCTKVGIMLGDQRTPPVVLEITNAIVAQHASLQKGDAIVLDDLPPQENHRITEQSSRPRHVQRMIGEARLRKTLHGRQLLFRNHGLPGKWARRLAKNVGERLAQYDMRLEQHEPALQVRDVLVAAHHPIEIRAH